MSTQMRPQIKPAPVRKSIFVNAPQDRAFEVFTAGIGRWWPKTHHVGSVDPESSIIESGPNGRWYQLNVDGSECNIGKVLVWDPPRRLLLAWQLNSAWQFDPALITELEVLFTPDGDGTRVELEHRHLERMGDGAEAVRERINSPNGWGHLLQLFASVTERQEKENGE